MHASERHKRVLLIVGGGIAAYKALELIRLLKARHIAVTPLLTKAGAQFVTPMALAALAGEKVHDDLFSLTDEVEMGHIALARAADLIVVAPATADLMARAAAGLAGDLAATVLLATDQPVLMAPAMNVRMWEHPATRRNAARLAADGIAFIGPEVGDMACGEQGPGRMAEPQDIAARIVEMLNAGEQAANDQPLRGRTVLITAGPTREPIDAARYISNHSSGKQGYALAAAARDLGAEVTLISGPVSLPPPAGVRVIPVQTADEMLRAARDSLPADVGVFAAAVADWRVKAPRRGKLKKAAGPPQLELAPNPDILATIAADRNRPRVVVGFAAETDDLLTEARRKLEEKGCDLIVANDVSPHRGTFGGDANEVTLIGPDGTERWPRLPKRQVARRLMRRIAAMLEG
ncbi:MAG TPA: bifunctional phosphopantothenoylcysteine decarboxylase/phosphopantothenate--cysteine ligase CoaBC [Thermopetrobacter sp.]|nr:bifunctional phosphopantothenoylcysteine decarboxylase/phosphopantothenate--cysteine ligase CoaBC [Thermopetrobacter sp.]